MDIDRLLEILLKLIDVRTFFLCLLIFSPLEYFFPIHKRKSQIRAGWLTDVQHFFISGIFIRLGLAAVVVMSGQIGSGILPASIRATIGGLPVWFQVVAIIIIADLGFYVSHRLMHSVPFLWKFHAVHHSSEQLDWLAAFRVHPVDQVIVKGTSLIPVFALGFSGVSIGIAALAYHWQSILIHSNFRVRPGIFRWWVATPEFHHWHHANQPEALDKNFSGQLPLWDLLFRTAYLPGVMPANYGTHDPVPREYLQQMTDPFRRIVASVFTWSSKKSS